MRILVLLLSLSFTALSFAQDHSFAVGGGLSFSKADTDESLGSGEEEEIGASLNAGVRGVFKMSDALYFRTGAYLQEKAAKYSVDVAGFDGESTARVISAAIPLNLQYKINDRFGVFGGYSADFTINEYCNVDGDFDSCSLREDAKSVVHNAVIGASVFGNHKLDVDVSYQHGLTEAFDEIKIHTFLIQGFVKF